MPLLSRRLAIVAVLALGAPPLARAEEGEWAGPPFDRAELALTEDTLPKGWSFLSESEAAEGAAKARAAVTAAREAAGVPETEVNVEVSGLRTGSGARATVALVDVHVEPKKLRDGLEALAKKDGLGFRELASPARLLLVWAPPAARDEVLAAHVRGSAVGLGRAAWDAVSDTERTDALAKAALSLEPGLGLPHLASGYSWSGRIEQDAEARERAIASLGYALAARVVPLTESERAIARGTLAGALLYRKTAEDDAKARDLLKEALATPGDIPKRGLLGWRYNLACAHARLKEVDPAFEHLTAVLEAHEESPIQGISHWRKDPDFESLKPDPRWGKLLESHPEKPESD
jgi:hypothetical protein